MRSGSSASTAADISLGNALRHLCIILTVDTAAEIAEMPPALAFGSHSSVFKEQPRTEPRGAEVRDPSLLRGVDLPPQWRSVSGAPKGGLQTIAALATEVNAGKPSFRSAFQRAGVPT